MKGRLFVLAGLLAVFVNACSTHDGATFSSDHALLPVSTEDSAAYGRSAEPVTIRIGLHIPAADRNPVSEYILALTNIKIIHPWEAEGEEAYKQKLDLAIASRDLPDAMVVDRTQLGKLIESDMIQDLSGVYETYASGLVKNIYESTNGSALKDASVDGKLYGLPNVAIEADSPSLLWLRQDWLEKLKLTPPRSLEDVERIAQDFITLDPDGDGKNNTTGLPGYKLLVYGQKPKLGGFDAIFHAFGAYPKSWVKDKTGQAVYGSITEENKLALAKLADWYKRGLIDRQFALSKGVQEPIVTNKTGMFFGPWWAPYWPLADSISLDAKAEWRAYAVPLRTDGTFAVHMAPVTDRYLVVRKGYANPEAAVKLLNVVTRLERKQDPNTKVVKQLDNMAANSGRTLRNLFPFDLLLDYSDGVMKRYEDIENVLGSKKSIKDLNSETLSLYQMITQEKQNPKKNLEAWMTTVAYESGIQSLVSTPLSKSRGVYYGTTPTMETQWSFLERLENETFLKIIMGELPIDAFDLFVKQWKASGGEQITSEVNYSLSRS
jgi:putative aldouronate transport system substrate-binding protein